MWYEPGNRAVIAADIPVLIFWKTGPCAGNVRPLIPLIPARNNL
jgi:hypothetical protein